MFTKKLLKLCLCLSAVVQLVWLPEAFAARYLLDGWRFTASDDNELAGCLVEQINRSDPAVNISDVRFVKRDPVLPRYVTSLGLSESAQTLKIKLRVTKEGKQVESALHVFSESKFLPILPGTEFDLKDPLSTRYGNRSWGYYTNVKLKPGALLFLGEDRRKSVSFQISPCLEIFRENKDDLTKALVTFQTQSGSYESLPVVCNIYEDRIIKIENGKINEIPEALFPKQVTKLIDDIHELGKEEVLFWERSHDSVHPFVVARDKKYRNVLVHIRSNGALNFENQSANTGAVVSFIEEVCKI